LRHVLKVQEPHLDIADSRSIFSLRCFCKKLNIE
jgi:hypothetical protein